VAVFGVNAGILPHRLAEDEEEERRILHVAITRCKQQVVVLADQARPSPFVAELDRPAPPVSVRPGRGAASGGGAGGRASGRASAAAKGPAPVPTGVNPAVEQALRAWRTERARKDGMPPYIVLHDRTLLAIAGAQPSSLVALRQVDGIGPAKLELYGEDILAVVAEAAG
jgi:superfamily II DNA helicase RecQ